MKLLKFEQGSPEWLEWRRVRITATDAATILGCNPFKTIRELWEEKLEMVPSKPATSAMKRGSQLEPEARIMACERLERVFNPAVVEHDDRYWQAASLDGLSETETSIMEIKCPSSATHEFALANGIHHYYMCQMQHQMAVTGCGTCFYVSYRPENKEQPIKIIQVLPDLDLISELTDMEHRFYVESLCRMKDPVGLKRFRRD